MVVHTVASVRRGGGLGDRSGVQHRRGPGPAERVGGARLARLDDVGRRRKRGPDSRGRTSVGTGGRGGTPLALLPLRRGCFKSDPRGEGFAGLAVGAPSVASS